MIYREPKLCYLCDEIVTFCECEKSITNPIEALEILRARSSDANRAVRVRWDQQRK